MRTADEMHLLEAGEAIASALRGRTFGSITLDRVDVDAREDAFGGPAVFIVAWSSSPQEMRTGRRGDRRLRWDSKDRRRVDVAFSDALAQVEGDVRAYFSLMHVDADGALAAF